MRANQSRPARKKPEQTKGLRGLFLYGILTILGALALVVAAE